MEVLASRSIANHVDKPPLAWTDRITSWWTYPILDPLWVRLCLIGTMILICAARALIGLKATSVFTHDAFMFLDGAWRMMNGQRPHIDFYSHLGVLTYAPTVLGLWLSRG